MAITEEEEQQLAFFKRLNALLSRPVEKEPQELSDAKEVINSLKWRIRYLLEDMAKEDLFSDDVSVGEMCSAFVDEPLDRYIQMLEKPWLKDKLTVALLGNISTGKTTLLNSFFGEHFQTDVEETTALATYLYYGCTSDCRVVGNDGSILPLRETDIGIFDIDKSDSFPFPRMFGYIAKENSSPILKEITFIDTPGVSSFDQEHTKPTIQAIQNSDVAFWLVNVRKSIEKDELSFIKDNIGEKPIYFILTYSDLKRGLTEEGRAKAVNVIKQRIAEAGIEPKGFLLFGKTDDLLSEFKRKFGMILQDMSSEYKPSYPFLFVLFFLKKQVEELVKFIKSLTEGVTELEDKKDSLGNNFNSKSRTLSARIDSLSNSLDGMIDTFNNSCSGMGCGAAYQHMKSKLSAGIDSWNNMLQAYNELDYSDLVSYGNYIANIEDLKNRIERINIIKNKFEALINQFE